MARSTLCTDLVAKLDERLGQRQGERPQPGTEATDENQSLRAAVSAGWSGLAEHAPSYLIPQTSVCCWPIEKSCAADCGASDSVCRKIITRRGCDRARDG